jgi:hypothetical protein
MQSVRKHMDLRLCPGHELAVEPDKALALIERNDGHALLLGSRSRPAGAPFRFGREPV